MRWLCFLLASPLLAQAKPLRFDVAALSETRDSFVFHLRGAERGWAVWQYERRVDEMGQTVVFTAVSELQPAEAESLHITLNRLTGAPLSSFHRIEMFSPESDTTLVEHDLTMKRGTEVQGRRRVGTRSSGVRVIPVSVVIPAATVWSDYGLLAAAVTGAAPGDSLVGRAYSEFGDTLTTLTLVAEAAVTVTVPAGTFEAVPLRGAGYRLFVTRGPGPRRVVKGESLDHLFDFELAASGPVVRSAP
jgi:hypothetical protein